MSETHPNNPYDAAAIEQVPRSSSRNVIRFAMVLFFLFAIAIFCLLWGYQHAVRLERQIRERETQTTNSLRPEQAFDE